MKPHCLALACLAAAFAVWLWQSLRPVHRPRTTVSAMVMTTPPPISKPPASAVAMAAEQAPAARGNRAEMAKQLQRFFSKEQLGLELELEQARYRGQYWQTEPSLVELQSIETRRAEALQRLATEMNAMLAEMCPGETGEPLALVSFFSLDRPAPNLGFLSEVSREKIEQALLTRDATWETDPMAAAATILSGQELTDYARWNAPQSAALRNRLAGYDATENEFAAILQAQAAIGSDRETEARVELARSLGADRLAQLDRLNDPATHTAMQDLHRLGLPLESADWLADFRRQASGLLQQSWSDARLTDAQKQTEVGVLREAFRTELALQMKLLPDADLLP